MSEELKGTNVYSPIVRAQVETYILRTILFMVKVVIRRYLLLTQGMPLQPTD